MHQGEERAKRRAVRIGLIAGGLALTMACQSLSSHGPGSAGGKNAANPFPSQAELDKLGPAPPASELARLEVDEVDSWTLQGPFPDRVEDAPRPAGSPWEEILDQAVARRAGLAVVTEAMQCTARELGHFLLVRGKLPPPTLLEFMAARCGAPVAEVTHLYVKGAIPATVDDSQVREQWRPQLDQLLSQALAGGPATAGLWFGRDGDRAVVAVVAAPRRVLIAPFSPVETGDRLIFGGEVVGNPDGVTAWANRGALGFTECDRDPKVALPRFAFSCALDPDDPFAVIDVAARERGRILAEGVLRVLARRPGKEAREWRRTRHAAMRPASTPEDFTLGVAEVLGDVRKKADLHPLVLSKSQSEQVAELVPHVLAGELGIGPSAVSDLAALGVLAGYRVGGSIKDAGMTSAALAGPMDSGLWVDTALEEPMGRSALLDPDARVLAVGAMASEKPPVLVAIAATYQLFGEEDLNAEAARYAQRVAQVRSGQGKSAPKPLASVQAVAEHAAQTLAKSKIEPQVALNDALAKAGSVVGRPVRGWYVEGRRVEDLPIPDDLSNWDSLEMAVAVGYYQPADEPWGRLVVFVIALPPEVGI
ncbi:MAG TPA: hypothetical protein VEG67_00065 [Myxococcota bacterium]|nr:hypothetical protein [Myxococcota bacterium]